MDLQQTSLLVGLLSLTASLRPFLRNIRQHQVKVYLTLPGWTVFVFTLGLILGWGLSKQQEPWNYIILFSLFICIPLYSWIDAEFIYKKEKWGFGEYVWGCLYELGIVSLGTSTYFYFK